MSQVTANGNTYSDDGTAALDMGNGGHRNYLLPMLGDTIVECDAAVSAAVAAAVAAAASESAALGSATAAQNYAAALKSTSTSSLAVGTGSKTFTTQASKQYAAGQWVTATSAANSANWMFGQVTSYTTTTLVINVTAVGGSGTLADWNISIAGVQGPTASGAVPLTRSARTSNTVLGTADIGTLIDVTSGTFSQTFSAVATLGSGWWCYIRNSGTGDITLDPNASETIDGLTSFVMYPGSVRLIQCNGYALLSIPVVGGTKVFTSTANYVWAPGIKSWGFDMIAGGSGGGSGARSGSVYNGGGGGAGERWKSTIAVSEVTVGGSTTCTVGAAGTGGTAPVTDNTSGNTGVAGGNSSIGAYRTASGGGLTGSNSPTRFTHGYGHPGGGKYTAPLGSSIFPSGQGAQEAVSPSSEYLRDTEWGGPAGRPGDDPAVARVALLGGQVGGLSGGALAAGTSGTTASTKPGSAGNGGAGCLNGSTAGSGSNGRPGQITIVEVI